jgi:hypothetical protein
MAKSKTTFTGASVQNYIAVRGSDQQRTDCRELMALFQEVTQQPPKMWGPSIVGFGSNRYTYESGHTGEAPLAGFAIRGRELVIYLPSRTSGRPCCRSLALTRWASTVVLQAASRPR